MATKKCLTKIFFSPLSILPVFGSGIRDPGSGMGKNQDPGSGINIPDPQHCCNLKQSRELTDLIKMFYVIKGGCSANKLCKLLIRKFADINNLLDLRTLRKCGTSRISGLRNQFLAFCRLKLLQVRKSILFSFQIWPKML